MSMTYELAKQLKDAGFPLNDPLYEGYPTLSELIEAVKGEKMHTFELTFNQEWATYEPANEDGPWAARYYDLTPVGFYEAGAKTPEEAVAHLWLALSKHE